MNQSFRLLVYRKLYACMISLMLLFSFIPVNSLASGNFQLTAVPGCKENILSWKALSNASTYQVYLYLSDGTRYPLFDFPRPDLFYSHKDLIEGKEYCYVVVAYDKDAKEIGKSNRVCAIPKNCDEPNEDECEIELKYTVGKKPYFVNNKPFEMDTEPEIKPVDSTQKTARIMGIVSGNCNAGAKVAIHDSTGKIQAGWLEGTPADSKTPIRFYFDATQKQWSNIKLDQCIEICYEERKDRAGNTINWAFDYRVVECPKGIPVEQYQVQHSLINDRILFEKEEIQRTKKA